MTHHHPHDPDHDLTPSKGKLLVVPAEFPTLDRCSEFCWNVVTAALEKSGLRCRIATVRTALHEAICNAYCHGSQKNPQTPILFSWQINGNELVCSIRDQGEGFDYHRLPDPTTGENIVKEWGRGIFMICRLADRVCWQHDGRQITMFFTLQGEGTRTSEQKFQHRPGGNHHGRNQHP